MKDIPLIYREYRKNYSYRAKLYTKPNVKPVYREYSTGKSDKKEAEKVYLDLKKVGKLIPDKHAVFLDRVNYEQAKLIADKIELKYLKKDDFIPGIIKILERVGEEVFPDTKILEIDENRLLKLKNWISENVWVNVSSVYTEILTEFLKNNIDVDILFSVSLKKNEEINKDDSLVRKYYLDLLYYICFSKKISFEKKGKVLYFLTPQGSYMTSVNSYETVIWWIILVIKERYQNKKEDSRIEKILDRLSILREFYRKEGLSNTKIDEKDENMNKEIVNEFKEDDIYLLEINTLIDQYVPFYQTKKPL